MISSIRDPESTANGFIRRERAGLELLVSATEPLDSKGRGSGESDKHFRTGVFLREATLRSRGRRELLFNLLDFLLTGLLSLDFLSLDFMVLTVS